MVALDFSECWVTTLVPTTSTPTCCQASNKTRSKELVMNYSNTTSWLGKLLKFALWLAMAQSMHFVGLNRPIYFVDWILLFNLLLLPHLPGCTPHSNRNLYRPLHQQGPRRVHVIYSNRVTAWRSSLLVVAAAQVLSLLIGGCPNFITGHNGGILTVL